MTIKEANDKGLLKVGVKVITNGDANSITEEFEGVVGAIETGRIYIFNNYKDGYRPDNWGSVDKKGYIYSWYIYMGNENAYIKILNSKNTMSLTENFILALTKEPNKSFRKANVTNGDDLLTEEGQQVFLSWLLHSKYADDFKKEVVDDMLAEQEKEKK